jgi:hypothetical protein
MLHYHRSILDANLDNLVTIHEETALFIHYPCHLERRIQLASGMFSHEGLGSVSPYHSQIQILGNLLGVHHTLVVCEAGVYAGVYALLYAP